MMTLRVNRNSTVGVGLALGFAMLMTASPTVRAVTLATWSLTGSLSTAHTNGATATRLADGRVLVVGGLGSSAAEIYDPATGGWTAVASMSVPRAGHTSTLLPNGKALVTGGLDQMDCFPDCPVIVHQTAEIYDPSTDSWTLTAPLTTPRSSHTATDLGNGRVLLVGGFDLSGVFSTSEIYNPMTNTWSARGSMLSHRSSHTATRLGNGMVLVAGGYGITNAALQTAELFNPVTGKFTPTGNMVTSRGFHTAARIMNGMVLVAGGINGPFTPGFPALGEAELYDPATGSWSPTGSMTTPRFANTLNLLLNGQVLAAGGEDMDVSVLQSSETYNPGSGVWTAGPDMTTPRASATGTLLQNGQVLVASGFFINNALLTAELYTP